MTSKNTSSTPRLQPLNSRVITFDDEPAYALASRLARRNGVKTLASFAADMGISHREILYGRRNRYIALLAGADPDKLDRATFRIGENKQARLGDEELHKVDWSHESLHVCPHCIQGDIDTPCGDPAFRAHIRSWWNIRYIRVCPFHRVKMVDCSPGEKVTLINPAMFDIHSLLRSEDHFMDERGETQLIDDVRAESYILGRLGFMHRTKLQILDDLPLWNAIRLIDRVGAAAVGGPQAHTFGGGAVGHHDAIAAGFSIFAEEKDGFFQFLDSLLNKAGFARNQWVPRANYGRLYEWLHHDMRHIGAYDRIRDLLREHVGQPSIADDGEFEDPQAFRRAPRL